MTRLDAMREGELRALLSMVRAMLAVHPDRADAIKTFDAVMAEEEAHALASPVLDAYLDGLHSMGKMLRGPLPPEQRPGFFDRDR